MNLLELLISFLKITAPLCSIAFTYVKYRDYKKKRKEKGSSDAATSDKPDNGCHKDN